MAADGRKIFSITLRSPIITAGTTIEMEEIVPDAKYSFLFVDFLTIVSFVFSFRRRGKVREVEEKRDESA